MSGPSTVPLSRRFLERLASLGTVLRPPHGRPGRPAELTVAAGTITARVQGTRATPYTVRIGLSVLSSGEWTRIERAIAADRETYEQVVDGDLPEGIEELFARCGLALLPARARDLSLECSCPDWEVPCAHLSWVLNRLAADLDTDPYLLLTWRGRDRDELLDDLRQSRTPAAPAAPPEEPPLSDCLDTFWGSADEPAAGLASAPADIAPHRLGRPGIVIRGRSLTDVLGPAYEAFTSW